MNFDRYKENLRIEGNEVWSYTTHVATIKFDKLIQLPYSFKHGDVKKEWSSTTQRHINYVARQLKLTLIKKQFQDNMYPYKSKYPSLIDFLTNQEDLILLDSEIQNIENLIDKDIGKVQSVTLTD